MAQKDLISVCRYLMMSGCKQDSDLESQDQKIALVEEYL